MMEPMDEQPMSDLAPRSTIGAVVGVWIAAAFIGVAVGLLAPAEWRMAWMIGALGGCIVLTFAVQLWLGRANGFIDRVALTAGGATLVMGVISAVFGVVALIPG